MAAAVEAVDSPAPPPAATRIGAGPVLRPGFTGERVARLNQRLVALGLLEPAAAAEPTYGLAQQEAVKKFQRERGLSPDGTVGETTRLALEGGSGRVNVSHRPAAPVSPAVRRTLEQMRTFQASAPDDYVLVNLPSQTVTVVRGGKIDFTMRAAVGRPSRETPLLADDITHVIVNPTWTVPPTILRQDKLPKLRATGAPGIADAAIYLDGAAVAPESVDWQSVSPRRVRIVQRPGAHNALGRFRFNMTNDQNIYLHDTNEPRVFKRDARAVSSGCVRLAEPRRLAELLLAEQGVTPADIDRMLASGTTRWIKLNKPLPVRFVYWTATVGADQRIQVHPDIYNRDETKEERAAREARALKRSARNNNSGGAGAGSASGHAGGGNSGTVNVNAPSPVSPSPSEPSPGGATEGAQQAPTASGA